MLTRNQFELLPAIAATKAAVTNKTTPLSIIMDTGAFVTTMRVGCTKPYNHKNSSRFAP